ncbi:MAG: Ni/Fe hydrogenase subunit alpha [bacterium]
MKRTITIDPLTRLEGHGKVVIFLNQEGAVENTYLQIPELRGFEKFCEGRCVEELPRITPKICGVCPGAHHMASTKALDRVFKVAPPPAAVKLRRVFYLAHFLHSHIAHFYLLTLPDFALGPDFPPSKRNVLGLSEKLGVDIISKVVVNRGFAQKIQEIIGGRATLPVCGIPGGMSKSLSEEEREKVQEMAEDLWEFSKFTLDIFHQEMLGQEKYVAMMKAEFSQLPTSYMGLVDSKNEVCYYDGQVKVVSPEGEELVKFDGGDYLDVIEEIPLPWTYLKFPYLKKLGWKGLVPGQEGGIYRVGPLARLNVAEGMSTPLAQKEYRRMYRELGEKPSHSTFAYHWARVIEIVNCAEELYRLSQDEDITEGDLRAGLNTPDEGVGVVEAPRGTLFHHYKTDQRGIVQEVNLIVATVQNNAGISMSVREAAKGLIKEGKVREGLTNRVEMVVRSYDPCIACATHCMGTTSADWPVEIYDTSGNMIEPK